MRYKWLVVLGVIAVLAFAMATLPASVLASRAGKYGVRASSWTGSIWSGAARDLSVRGRALGSARWSISPRALLSARLAGHGALSQDGAEAVADFSLSTSGRAELRNVIIDAPFAALAALPGLVPRGWTGRVQGHLDALTLDKGWPVAASGMIDIVDVVAPPPHGGAIGSYRIAFPDPSATGDADRSLQALVTEIDGPLAVLGHLRLASDRSYELRGYVSRKGASSSALDQAVEMLGPPDSSGRREFGLSGTF